MEVIGTWDSEGKIEATIGGGYGLAVWEDGRLVGCALDVERAQELVNERAGERVWGEPVQ